MSESQKEPYAGFEKKQVAGGSHSRGRGRPTK